MTDTLRHQIREFLSATRNPYSYDIIKNIYIWFGILWGLPIPLVTITLQSHFLQTQGVTTPVLTALTSPTQWFFLAHPVIFGFIFGVLGTIRNVKETQLTKVIEKLRDLSSHDPLTGLKNRRHFAHNFHDECARSLRNNEPLTLLFMDIDHFKKINDSHGHYIGDVVLKEISAFLLDNCRPYDTAVRWGGEEFIILLPGTDEKHASVIAERIRVGIASGSCFSVSFQITISIGLAQYKDNDTLEVLIDRADQALYHAKQTGRNRVVKWSDLAPQTTE